MVNGSNQAYSKTSLQVIAGLTAQQFCTVAAVPATFYFMYRLSREILTLVPMFLNPIWSRSR